MGRSAARGPNTVQTRPPPAMRPTDDVQKYRERLGTQSEKAARPVTTAARLAKPKKMKEDNALSKGPVILIAIGGLMLMMLMMYFILQASLSEMEDANNDNKK
eukprot:PhF_6_TR29911/c0_g1_i1/m.43854